MKSYLYHSLEVLSLPFPWSLISTIPMKSYLYHSLEVLSLPFPWSLISTIPMKSYFYHSHTRSLWHRKRQKHIQEKHMKPCLYHSHEVLSLPLPHQQTLALLTAEKHSQAREDLSLPFPWSLISTIPTPGHPGTVNGRKTFTSTWRPISTILIKTCLYHSHEVLSLPFPWSLISTTPTPGHFGTVNDRNTFRRSTWSPASTIPMKSYLYHSHTRKPWHLLTAEKHSQAHEDLSLPFPWSLISTIPTPGHPGTVNGRKTFTSTWKPISTIPMKTCLYHSHEVLSLPFPIPWSSASTIPMKSCLYHSHEVLSLPFPWSPVSTIPMKFCLYHSHKGLSPPYPWSPVSTIPMKSCLHHTHEVLSPPYPWSPVSTIPMKSCLYHSHEVLSLPFPWRPVSTIPMKSCLHHTHEDLSLPFPWSPVSTIPTPGHPGTANGRKIFTSTWRPLSTIPMKTCLYHFHTRSPWHCLPPAARPACQQPTASAGWQSEQSMLVTRSSDPAHQCGHDMGVSTMVLIKYNSHCLLLCNYKLHSEDKKRQKEADRTIWLTKWV